MSRYSTLKLRICSESPSLEHAWKTNLSYLPVSRKSRSNRVYIFHGHSLSWHFYRNENFAVISGWKEQIPRHCTDFTDLRMCHEALAVVTYATCSDRPGECWPIVVISKHSREIGIRVFERKIVWLRVRSRMHPRWLTFYFLRHFCAPIDNDLSNEMM